MEHFPVFLNLSGREVFLCGNSKKALEKLEILRGFGPRICVFSPNGGAEGAEIYLRPLAEEDLERRPALVVTACSEEEDARIVALCRERNIPVNAVDRPDLCTFIFPSLICREHLCIAISTGGSSPAAAAELKRRVETQIPEGIDEVLDWMSGLRARLYAGEPNKMKARKVLRLIAAQAIREGRPLTEEEILELANSEERI